MKIKDLLLLMLLFSSIMCFAQHPKTNTIKALVFYQKDENGYYHATKDTVVNDIGYVISYYGYDKENNHLYALTSNCNCEITLTKDSAKMVKKSSIPRLKDDKLTNEITNQNKKLEDKYNTLNDERSVYISDSISILKNMIRKDSIRKEQEKIKEAQEKTKEDNYRLTHNWQNVPTPRTYLKCTMCDYSDYVDSAFCVAIIDDYMYYFTSTEKALGYNCLKIHKSFIDNTLKNDENFQYHYKVFKDSLTHDTIVTDSLELRDFNSYLLKEFVDKVVKKAPYGYIDEWSWNNDYSMVTFSMSFVNTNRKTIKYIYVYFRVTNDVNDVRCTGHFKGTGPLEEFDVSSWNWDSSSYFTSGDATHMSLTKLIITYTDGTKKILPKNMILVNK
jgi:hypothetical protein